MSGVNKQLLSEFHQYLDKQEAFLDSFIDTGSDHDLFIASYIHGHFSVIAAGILNALNAPTNTIDSIDVLQEQTKIMLIQSIDKAIDNKELTEPDAQDVMIMRTALFSS